MGGGSDRQRQRNSGHHGVTGQAVERLGSHFDRWTCWGGIIDGMRRSGRRCEVGRSKLIDGTTAIIAKQAVQRMAKSGRVDGIEPSPSRQKRWKPFVEAAQ